ncbi:hypothetical protein J6590_027901 [Homalodisca vitripennis]|nr:hypothetical protein J6590_027901 [Homalodisca vitripennis]
MSKRDVTMPPQHRLVDTRMNAVWLAPLFLAAVTHGTNSGGEMFGTFRQRSGGHYRRGPLASEGGRDQRGAPIGRRVDTARRTRRPTFENQYSLGWLGAEVVPVHFIVNCVDFPLRLSEPSCFCHDGTVRVAMVVFTVVVEWKTMPHVSSGGGGDDLGSTDEVKVFKEEGDDEKRSSENLTEEKTSLIDLTESENLNCGRPIYKQSGTLGVGSAAKNNWHGRPTDVPTDHRISCFVYIRHGHWNTKKSARWSLRPILNCLT